MHGRVQMWRDGLPLFDVDNLVVNAATVAAANLAAGITAGNAVAMIGYGSGNATPSLNDNGLSGAAAYYNAIGTHSFPNAGSVLFNFSLTATDYGAITGINIQEIGLFGNTGVLGLPISIGIVTSVWAASHSYLVGNLIKDTNNNVQRCTTAGTSGSGAHPAWATSVGATTADGGVVWTMVSTSAAPQPMWTHALVPSFTFTGAANYVGSWTVTF